MSGKDSMTLPHSIESERALLGGLLLSPQAVAETARQIGPEDFYDARHRAIYRALETMAADMQPIDLTTVTERLRSVGQLDDAGGVSYVTKVSNATPTAATLSYHVEVVRKSADRRKAIEVAEEIIEAARRDGEKPESQLHRAERLLDIVRTGRNGERNGLEGSLVDSATLRTMPVEPRRFIVSPFFREGDLGFIYAKRGDGKTWLAMLLAKAAATGATAGPWKAEGVWPVLYVDGEMPAEESKRRDSALGGAGENLTWLHHEIFFDRTGRTLNLTNPATQAALTALLMERGFRVLVLDNLSCLFSGVKENDADAWELVLPWLLELRRRKIAVVIVAHAGRNGLMRGTSRREDAAFWVLKLERCGDGARELKFTSLFTKNRNALEDDCPPLEWTITAEADGSARVTAKQSSGVELLVSWVEAGLDSASDIAQEMGISKGQVSKLAKKAEVAGRIKIKDRRYLPAEGVGNG